MLSKRVLGVVLRIFVFYSLLVVVVACGTVSQPTTTPEPSPQSVSEIQTAAVTNSPDYTPRPPTPAGTPGGKKSLPDEVKAPFQQLTLADLPVTTYIPPAGQPNQPVQVLFVLHGMYDKGSRFSLPLQSYVIKNHLMMLAPTFSYNTNFKDPNTVKTEDIKLSAKLNQMLVEVAALSHQNLNSKVLVYGFSRGAQLAHRYALLYPTRVAGIAVLSAGAYTLPEASFDNQPLPFPYGISDLSSYTGQPFDGADFDKIPFCVEVGALDTDPKAVSPDWNAYSGINRVQRGQNFYNVLHQEGNPAQFSIIPNTGHSANAAMTNVAEDFFQQLLPTT